MRRVAAVGLRQPEPRHGRLVVAGTDRIVLEHRRGVEEFTCSGELLDPAEAEVLVGQQRALLLLEPGQVLQEGPLLGQSGAYRDGVDEQPDHRLGTGEFGRPGGDRRAEHHVVPPGQLGEHHRPGAL